MPASTVAPAAVRAACWSAAVAGRLGAPLRLLHALPDFGPNITEAAAAFRAIAMTYHSQNADRFLNEAEEAVRAAHPSVTVFTTATSDSVDDALIGASADARLMVLGGVDLSTAAAILLGSTTLRVTSHARCPVIAWRGTAVPPSNAPIVVGLDESSAAATVSRCRTRTRGVFRRARARRPFVDDSRPLPMRCTDLRTG